MNSDTLEHLQKALANAATQVPVDVNLIQDITARIARLDPDNVRFTIDAAIITRLGQELVGKQETAVAELVKNSFDADATDVKLVFANTNVPGGSLLIEDNGRGMTREEILNGFMRLASSGKQLTPISSYYRRRRAGRKGIGRFAVQRLGEELHLTTQTEDSPDALHVVIKWSAFQSGIDLDRITSHIEKVPKKRAFGTTLDIKKLREAWSEAEQKRVYRYISDILQPFPLTKLSEQHHPLPNDSIDPGFKVTLIQKSDGEDRVIASQEETVFSHALAIIEGRVDNKGIGKWSLKSKLLGIDESDNLIGLDRDNNESFAVLKNVAFKAYYFIYKTDLLPKLLFSTIQELGRKQGGLKVFLNGFRVAPYGDTEDDWLGLDYSEAKRMILPPSGNQNFFGFVELDDPQLLLFKEKASREGFDENQAFDELRKFVYTAIKAAVLRVAEVRERKQTAGQENWKQSKRDPAEVLTDKLDELVKALDKAKLELKDNTLNSNVQEQSIPDIKQKKILAEVTDAVQEINQVAKEAVEHQSKRQAHLLEELGMLRVLASLGIVIGEFTHEIRQTLNAAQINTDDLSELLSDYSEDSTDLHELSVNLSRLRSYASYFDHTVSDNANRELAPQDLRLVAQNFVDAVEKATKRLNTVIEFEANGYDLFTPDMHTSELSSILFNFYSNSLKAIRRERRSGKILIRVGSESDRVYLEFADNGDGVPPEISERIFNAFFTTSSPASKNSTFSEEAQGSGLGLKIVKDIVTAHQGEVFLTSPPVGYKTCFRVELPFNIPFNGDN